MVRRWARWRDPWDREYAKRGRLWRGRADLTPLPTLCPPPSPLLEIGCGDGKFLAAAADAGYACVGIDRARHGLRLVPSAIPCVQGDAVRLPVRDGAFPIIAARYLLGALLAATRRMAAAEMERCLAPNGVLLVEEFSPQDFRFGTGTPVEPHTFERNAGITTHYFEVGELASLFHRLRLESESGVSHTQRVGIARRVRASHRMLFRKPE